MNAGLAKTKTAAQTAPSRNEGFQWPWVKLFFQARVAQVQLLKIIPIVTAVTRQQTISVKLGVCGNQEIRDFRVCRRAPDTFGTSLRPVSRFRRMTGRI